MSSVRAQSDIIFDHPTFAPWQFGAGVIAHHLPSISYDSVTITDSHIWYDGGLVITQHKFYCMAIDMLCPSCSTPNTNVTVVFDNQAVPVDSYQQMLYYDVKFSLYAANTRKTVYDCAPLRPGTYTVYIYADNETLLHSVRLYSQPSALYLVTPVAVEITNTYTTTEHLLTGIRDYMHATYTLLIGSIMVIVGLLSMLFLRMRV
ncbi:MAG: hypothetical protein HC880_03095 [Bacteroidia bacterium]|nr:hypothetical protein [Bacteroidia bacterium]